MRANAVEEHQGSLSPTFEEIVEFCNQDADTGNTGGNWFTFLCCVGDPADLMERFDGYIGPHYL